MPNRVQRFEDLIAWQKARSLRKDLCALTRSAPFRRDFNLADQVRRAALSVMANIAEGCGRTGERELHRFLSTSKGSCTEVRSHLYAALDDQLIDQSTFEVFLARTEEVDRILHGLRAAVARRISQADS
jgi:four helix bundle protein